MTTKRDHEPAIRVQSIEKSFKELHVLRGVNFDVAPGSIFALLGSNGAGKTTMVRILSTLLRPDAAQPPLMDSTSRRNRSEFENPSV